MAIRRSACWSLGLMLSLLLPFAGTSGWLIWHRQQIKREVKARILAGVPASELVHFSFTPDQLAELRWEHEWEFVYQDQWFDVTRREIKGDTLHLWCWPDHAETALEHQLHALVDQALGRDTQRRERQARLFEFGRTLFCQSPADLQLNTPFSPVKANLFHYSAVRSRALAPPPSPPPRRVCPLSLPAPA
ncbi:MAG: hypothetical protein KDC54_11315 [Lewinella sp.]|nr:hypothetical protein [Lewinella sp.]